jgi:integrase
MLGDVNLLAITLYDRAEGHLRATWKGPVTPMATTLTPVTVAKLKARQKCREVRDAGSRSLFLVIQPSGHKSWALRWKKDGKRFKFTLGSCDVSGKELEGEPEVGGHLTLAAARRLASEIHRQRALGRDPVAEKKAVKTAVSVEASPTGFATAVREYCEKHCRDFKGHRGWARTAKTLGLRYDGSQASIIPGGLCHGWADRPVSEITEDDCFRVVEDARDDGIPGRGVKINGQSSARERDMANALGGLFRWLRKRRRIAVNPMDGLERPEASGVRERVLKSTELRRLWEMCGDGPFGRVVKVMMLTGAHTDEVAGMRRSELSDDTWSVPVERIKIKHAYTVPLAPMVKKILDESDSDLVFTTNGRTPFSGFSKAKASLDKRLGFSEPWQLRDLRRTMVTGMAEIGIQPHIVEACVNHIGGHKKGIARVYNKAEYEMPKRRAMERWAAHVEALVSGEKADNVAQLRA